MPLSSVVVRLISALMRIRILIFFWCGSGFYLTFIWCGCGSRLPKWCGPFFWCGCGSRLLKWCGFMDPDPQHCLWVKNRNLSRICCCFLLDKFLGVNTGTSNFFYDRPFKISFLVWYAIRYVYGRYLATSVADPGSGAFLTPGSGMGFFRIPDLGSRIPNPYFLKLNDNFLDKKFYNT